MPAHAEDAWRVGATDITAAVLARDEERHLADCLRGLTWADDVLVLDSGSTDRTRTIALEHGARVEVHPFENYSLQRQHALSLVRSIWVLFVDADERVPPALAEEAIAAVRSGRADGFWIPRRNVFWGHSMQGGGWWPDHQLRLLRVACAQYDPERAVHEVASVDGTTECLVTPMVHLNYDSLAEFRSKQRHYSELEARRRAADGLGPSLHGLILQPLREFARRYVGLRGWRDGGTGLAVCGLMAWYELRTMLTTSRIQGRIRP